MLIMKSWKRQIKLANQENIKTLGEKENYKYLGILGAEGEKVRKVYLRRKWKLLETIFCRRILIKEMDT